MFVVLENPLHSGLVPTWRKSILFLLHRFFRFEDFWRRRNALSLAELVRP